MIELCKKIILIIFLIISCFLILFSNYFLQTYSNIEIDEMIYYLQTGLEGGSYQVVIDGIKDNIILFLLLIVLLSLPIIKLGKFSYKIKLFYKKNKFEFRLFPLINSFKLKFLYVTIIFFFSINFTYKTLDIEAYIEKMNESSSFIEDEYVDPRHTELIFPENKRNLVVIYLESFETTMMSEENEGAWKKTVTPELENLAINNINFSNTDLLGGAYPLNGATWTIAGLVASTAGIPLKIPINGNDYGTTDNFLNGAYSLGDILKKEDYNLKFMFGSDAKFGGRYQYFKKHGQYEIFDLGTAIDKGYMEEDESVFWGFEDGKLFEWAKDELTKLAQEDKPFNLNLLTVNTHFTDGWLEKGAEENFPTQYENVHAYSSKQVNQFLEWMEKQDFYSNTTVVLLGDHNSMQEAAYYKDKVKEGFERVTYNTIINAAKEPIREKNRVFSNADMYPTILSSIGVEIKGNKLGLGTDLFSNEETLFEEYGVDYVNKEMGKNSSFYNSYLLGEDYINLLNSGKE